MSQFIYEDLPSHSIDLDKNVVFTMGYDIEDQELGIPTITDRVVTSGCVHLVDTETGMDTPIYWGKTDPNTYGASAVVVDLPWIDLRHLQCLSIVGVIDGDYPTLPERKCPECGKIFSPTLGAQTECSQECNTLARTDASPDGF